MTSLRERFERYERGYDFYLIPRLPIIVRVSFSNPKYIFLPENPFTDTLGEIIGETFLSSIKEIEGARFGLFCGEEFNIILLPSSHDTDLWLGNSLQKIISFCSSLFSLHFNNLSLAEDLDWAGKIYFDSRAFVLPSFQEVVNYLIYRQHEGGKDFVFKAAKYILLKRYGIDSLKELSGASTSRQHEILEENDLSLDEFPSYFEKGIGCYKSLKLIKNDYGTTNKIKWGLDCNLSLIEDDPLFIRNILESGKDIFRSERDLLKRGS